MRGLVNKATALNVVGEASNGESAIRLVGELKPHVVLMDVVMPGMGGIEATRQIRTANPGVRVIALSMHAEGGFVDAMMDAGASGYVLKDRATSELVAAIQAAMAGEKYRGKGLS